MPVAIIGSVENEATARLSDSWRGIGIDAIPLSAWEALDTLGRGDVAVCRLDVREGVDGVEDGLAALLLLERRGVRVVNSVRSLLRAHDKLRTARVLQAASLPHPQTTHLRPAQGLPAGTRYPIVLKPRFGSWGEDVALCANSVAASRYLERVRDQPWFRRHGALVQEALPSPGYDLRVIVAAGRLVGAARRIAAPGEWRTNVSCGGTLQAAAVSDDVAELARTAIAVIDGDFMGVDILPAGNSYVVLEVNAAVDFDETYSLGGRHVDDASAEALFPARRRHRRHSSHALTHA